MTEARALIFALPFAALMAGTAGGADLRLHDRWALAGPVAWDYLTVDPSRARLFVTRDTQVDVLDTHSGKVVGTIRNTSGAHGVALALGTKRGYISNGKTDTVLMFDLETLQPLRAAQVPGHNPDAILYDAVARHLYTFNGRSRDVSVLSPTDLQVLKTFKVPGKPEFAVADGHGQIFVNIETEPGQLVAIDARRMAVTATWPLAGCNGPSGLAIDERHRRLFSVCDDKVMVVTDASTGRQIATLAIGDGPDAVSYEPRRALIFSSNGEGTLTVIHQDTPDRYSVIQTLATKKGSRTMALDPTSGSIFLASADFPAEPASQSARPQAVANSFAVLKVSP